MKPGRLAAANPDHRSQRDRQNCKPDLKREYVDGTVGGPAGEKVGPDSRASALVTASPLARTFDLLMHRSTE